MLRSEDEVVVEVGVGKNATSIVGYTYANLDNYLIFRAEHI